jgi:hypothetical protein
MASSPLVFLLVLFGLYWFSNLGLAVIGLISTMGAMVAFFAYGWWRLYR